MGNGVQTWACCSVGRRCQLSSLLLVQRDEVCERATPRGRLQQQDEGQRQHGYAPVPRLCTLGPPPLPHQHRRRQNLAITIVRLQQCAHGACKQEEQEERQGREGYAGRLVSRYGWHGAVAEWAVGWGGSEGAADGWLGARKRDLSGRTTHALQGTASGNSWEREG